MAKMAGRGGAWFNRDPDMRRWQVRKQKRIEEELWRQEENYESSTWASKSAEEIVEDIKRLKREAKDLHFQNKQNWNNYFQGLADNIEDSL